MGIRGRGSIQKRFQFHWIYIQKLTIDSSKPYKRWVVEGIETKTRGKRSTESRYEKKE